MLQDHAVVVFSGGQDSATCLAWALTRFARVSTLGFAYGQRHDVEMACRLPLRTLIAARMFEGSDRLGQDYVIPTDFFQHMEATALTSEQAIACHANGLPNTFVPGRNLLFLTMTAAWAFAKNIEHIVMGVCETDSSGYPDCRDDSIKAMQVAVNVGMDSHFVIHTPLMWRTKAQTWHLAERLGGAALVDIILEYSHTCYTGERRNRHAWGYGCGQCPACILRAQGFAAYEKGDFCGT